MQAPPSPSPDFVAASFARVLSALTQPPAPEGSTGADTDAATLSAELSEGVSGESARGSEAFSYEAALRRGVYVSALAASESESELPPGTMGLGITQNAESTPEPLSAEADAQKRPSSVTIRLSRAGCMQLKERAAEAGLTLSAYVRSCVFEAEALRTQVKQAVEALRREARAELCSETHVPAPAKKPAASERLTPDSAEPQRRWWQLLAN